MKNLILIFLLVTALSTKAQVIKINYWNWSSNHLKQEPQKWNRIDSWAYMPTYYLSPKISFTLKPFRWKRPSNYFLYRENKKVYKFIF